jgi:hypothetical protein
VADVFEEVEEQLRAQQLKTFALKALPWVGAGLVLALVAALAVWGWDHLRNQKAAAASEAYSEAMEMGARGDVAGAKAGLTKVSTEGPPAYRALALMQLGGLAAVDDKTAEAVKAFDEAASLVKDPLLADLARLKSAFALMDTAPYSELESRLTPLTAEKRPYRTPAREALAFAKLMAGNTAGARSDFVVLSLLPDSSEDARQRAQAAIDVIDSGTAASLPGAVKAAIAMPPMPMPQAPVAPPGPAQ